MVYQVKLLRVVSCNWMSSTSVRGGAIWWTLTFVSVHQKGRHGVFAGKTVWSMPERFEIYIVYKWRYINTVPFLSFLYSVWLSTSLVKRFFSASWSVPLLIHSCRTLGCWTVDPLLILVPVVHLLSWTQAEAVLHFDWILIPYAIVVKPNQVVATTTRKLFVTSLETQLGRPNNGRCQTQACGRHGSL